MSVHQPVVQVFQHITTQNIRAFAFGGSLGYAFSNGFWHHTPLIFLNPVGYSAYQLFVNQREIVGWGKQTLKELKN